MVAELDTYFFQQS
uniref:Uncharacterized protein n=1 Tax=Anguilla anguilla TaxID=7936 RepID=A0A0E9W9F5_ANGAN